MTPPPRHPRAIEGAAATLARSTELLLDGALRPSTDDVRIDGHLDGAAGGIVTAADVADGSAAMIARLIVDVESILRISRRETLHRLGLWVAAQEVPR